MAAAYAAYNGKPAIVCILGTGSNSCYFDGENLKIKLPSLGFLLVTKEAEVLLENNLVRRSLCKNFPDLHHEFEKRISLP
jgi:predicted PP-loop superfamily ATPase